MLVPHALRDALRLIALLRGTTLSALTQDALKQYVESYCEKDPRAAELIRRQPKAAASRARS